MRQRGIKTTIIDAIIEKKIWVRIQKTLFSL
jgi:hypothetical protein